MHSPQTHHGSEAADGSKLQPDSEASKVSTVPAETSTATHVPIKPAGFTPINVVDSPKEAAVDAPNNAPEAADAEPAKAARVDLGNGKFGCTLCSKTYDTKNNANRHIKEHNVTAGCVVAECAGKVFHRSDKLQLHWKTRHSTLDRALIKDELLKFYKHRNDEVVYFWLNGTTHTRRSPKKKYEGTVEGVDFARIAAEVNAQKPVPGPADSDDSDSDSDDSTPDEAAPPLDPEALLTAMNIRPGLLGLTYTSRSTQTYPSRNRKLGAPARKVPTKTLKDKARTSPRKKDGSIKTPGRIQVSNFDDAPWDVRLRDPLHTELLMMAGMKLDPKTQCLYDEEDAEYDDNETDSDVEMREAPTIRASVVMPTDDNAPGSKFRDDKKQTFTEAIGAFHNKQPDKAEENVQSPSSSKVVGKKRPSIGADPAAKKAKTDTTNEPAMRAMDTDDDYDQREVL